MLPLKLINGLGVWNPKSYLTENSSSVLLGREAGVWFFQQEFKSTSITKIRNVLFLLKAAAAEAAGCSVVISCAQNCVAL